MTARDIKEYKTLGLDPRKYSLGPYFDLPGSRRHGYPEIKIIGFMDPKNVRFELNVKNSIFIYPDERVSPDWFEFLMKQC